MVAVSDTGVGMSPEVREHVFEPFYTTKPSGQGTGLGLSMVYGFVRESGGHISVYSEEGHGSVFRLYFPRVDMPVTVEEMAEQAPAPRGTETVLVVDDDRSVRQLTCDFLRDLGYRVLEAGGSREALSLADSYEVALLLTDVVMPGISGTTLARQLQARYPSIRVLYMTGYTENGIGHYGIVDKDIPLITKPFNKHRLSRAVRGALSGR